MKPGRAPRAIGAGRLRLALSAARATGGAGPRPLRYGPGAGGRWRFRVRLRFLGANRQVTGSRYLLEAAGRRIMVDCGLFQERPFLSRNWEPSPSAPDRIDVLLLTHAHLDHCGLIPRLVREGFAGEVLATPPTVELARIVLEDSAQIQVEDAAYKKRRHEREGRRGPHPEVPLYVPEDAEAALARFRRVHYDRPKSLGEGVWVTFRDAGHILGSSMLEVTVREAPGGAALKVVFSGDVGPWGRPLLRDPSVFGRADWVVMESTYGDRNHAPEPQALETLCRILRETIGGGGNVVIPTFAIDRAQEILLLLSRLAHENRIPRIVVFLDSPMAIDATSVYKEYAYLLDAETRALLQSGRHPFQFPGLHLVRTVEESRAINTFRGPCVIMAGAGMCTGGRVKHHLRQNIGRPECTVLFTGYQARDTLGRQILDGRPEVRIHGANYPVRARIERLEGLSAHADRDGLMQWLGHFEAPPRRLFLTHGETEAAGSLADRVRRDLAWDVAVPEYGSTVELDG